MKKIKDKTPPPVKQSNVIYLGRIPHGFYEEQMRAYFSQFGAITNLRLSRNKKTGASKHYAFIEFAENEVAQVVAETMNNYLMFTSLLKCQVLPVDKVHPEIWKGANRRFVIKKHIPQRETQPLSAEQQERKKKLADKKRAKKARLVAQFLSLSADQ